MKSIKDKSKDTIKNSDNNNANDSNIINSLSQKSESELMSELFSVATKKRQEGSLNDSDLDNFQSQISSSLTEEQNKRLSEIISMLKR